MLVSTALIGSLFDSFFLGFPTTISSLAYSPSGFAIRSFLAFIGMMVAFYQAIITAHQITEITGFYLRLGPPSVNIRNVEDSAYFFIWSSILWLPVLFLIMGVAVPLSFISDIKNTNIYNFLTLIKIIYTLVTLRIYYLAATFLYRYSLLEKENPKYPTISYKKIRERLKEIKRSRYK